MGELTREQAVGVFVAKLNRPYWQGGFQNDGEVSEAVMGLLRAERERCARVADDVASKAGCLTTDCEGTAGNIAAAIRAGDERESDR